MDILKLLKKTGALLEGHFVLSSGLHSPKYLQCASVLQHPKYAEAICKELAKKISAKGGSAYGGKGKKIDVVVAPALGGVLVSYELARQLGARSLFAERKEGRMLLRRNFKIKKGEKALVCEDVVTTGGSTKEVMDVVKEHGGKVMAVAAIVDRSGKNNLFGKTRLYSLYKVDIETYQPDSCPLCKQGLPIDKPGSRK